MKSIIHPLLAILLVVAFISCKEDTAAPPLNDAFDAIPAGKYYDEDIFGDTLPGIYGKWEVIATSGGFHGGGYTPDFEYLLTKPNGIFGIERNDSLLTHGKMEILPDPAFLVEFVPEDLLDIELLLDNRKYIEIQSDTLFLYAPCCDRFDTILKKVTE